MSDNPEAIKPSKKPAKRRPAKVYHHGALRESLLENGLQLLQEVGIEDISLRQLAERVGVSAPALYHHFKNKQELLYALGMVCLTRFEQAVFYRTDLTPQAPSNSLERMISAYVKFAIENPEIYELLFGRQVWKTAQYSDFHRQARQDFRKLNEQLLQIQFNRKLRPGVNPLRLAQVTWATVHGLCRMYNDGLAFKAEDIEDIAKHACQMVERSLFAD